MQTIKLIKVVFFNIKMSIFLFLTIYKAYIVLKSQILYKCVKLCIIKVWLSLVIEQLQETLPSNIGAV